MSTQTVAIIGGGAVGITAAYDLAECGADVTVYEKSQVAGGSTGRAAGIIYDVFQHPADVAMAAHSFERFEQFDATGTQFEFTKRPFLWFATDDDPAGLARIEDRVDALRDLDRDVRVVDPPAIEDQFPGVETNDIAAAAISETAGYADPHQYTMWMAENAREAGATIRVGDPAEPRTDPLRVLVDGESHPVDAILVAAGIHTTQTLASAGLSVPIKPYRVQAMTCTPETGSNGAFQDSFPILHDTTDNFYYRPDVEGVLGGGGPGSVSEITDPRTWTRSADMQFKAGIATDLEHRLPERRLSMTSSWAGLCAATPDQRPLLGELAPGLFISAGWQGHGFMRAPAASEHITAAIRNHIAPPSAFDPTRFDGTEEFTVATGLSSH